MVVFSEICGVNNNLLSPWSFTPSAIKNCAWICIVFSAPAISTIVNLPVFWNSTWIYKWLLLLSGLFGVADTCSNCFLFLATWLISFENALSTLFVVTESPIKSVPFISKEVVSPNILRLCFTPLLSALKNSISTSGKGVLFISSPPSLTFTDKGTFPSFNPL